jgi:hypothetical protein
MARKRSTRPRRKKGENPFLPALLSLHERWTPEQIAAVLTGIDEPPEWILSRQLVLLLSNMPQRPTATSGRRPGPTATGGTRR